MGLIEFLSKRPKPVLLVWGFILLIPLGVLDHVTGPDVSFELFYLIPILLVAWFAGRSAGIIMSVASAIAAFFADSFSNARLESPTSYWNAVVQLTIFLLVAFAAAAVEALRAQQEAGRLEVLRRTDELKTALLQAVSHDLRTPLASIKTSVTSLLDPSVPWDPSAQRALLEGVDQECDRLNRLVGSLLDMSRIDGGVLHIERDWYSVDEVVHSALRRLKSNLQEYPVTLDLPEDLPLLPIDFVRIDQVLTNLLENATRYTPPGTPIRISARHGGGGVEVTVADHGHGVAPQHLPHLFDRFYRLTGTGLPHGTGLGLSIAKGMVQAHGGHIYARSWLGQGLSITFTLPLTLSTPGAPEQPGELSAAARRAPVDSYEFVERVRQPDVAPKVTRGT